MESHNNAIEINKNDNLFILPNETTTRFYTNHDFLTGLLNKKGFSEALNRELSNPSSDGGVMLLIDIDRLKRINILHGRHIGDAVLKLVADVLRHQKRDQDIVARLHKDKFVLALTNTSFINGLKYTTKINKMLNSLKLRNDSDIIEITAFVSTLPYVKETTAPELLAMAGSLLGGSHKPNSSIPAYLG